MQDSELFACFAGKPDKTGQQMDVWENFRDYNLTPPVGLIRADAHRLPFRPALQVLAFTFPQCLHCPCLADEHHGGFAMQMVALQCRCTDSTYADVPQ